MECLFLEASDFSWQVICNQTVPYPQNIRESVQAFQRDHLSLRGEELGRLDRNLTFFSKECADMLRSRVPKSSRNPDCIILKKFVVWQGDIGDEREPSRWNISLGDPQFLADSVQVPVLTDFIRHAILKGGEGIVPHGTGDILIAKKAGAIAAFVNLGLIADMTIIDSQKMQILVQSDTGPGTCLIDMIAGEAGLNDGFDRDGAVASTGEVRTDLFEPLSEDPWFSQPAPKFARVERLGMILDHPSLRALRTADKLATITAFTALSISAFFKKHYSNPAKPDTIWLSGGGTNNLSLVNFLKAYFEPIAVRNCEEIGVPDNSRVPLALGLTVQAYLEGKTGTGSAEGSSTPPACPGRWVWPA
jgi:anhydro-N-acetylmuramic acid kinase